MGKQKGEEDKMGRVGVEMLIGGTVVDLLVEEEGAVKLRLE